MSWRVWFIRHRRFSTNSIYGIFAWLPSQNAPFLECLQPHHATVLASARSTFFGAKPEPLWEPSQNG